MKSAKVNTGSTEALLGMIAEKIGEPLIGAEIGVHRGETSAKLLRRFKKLKLYMVDSWVTYPVDHPYRKSGDKCSQLSSEQQSENLQAAIEVVGRFSDGRGIVVCSDSSYYAGYCEDRSLDFAFIDGDHTLEGVRADIAAWWPLVRSGGLLCGHDFGHRRNRTGKFGVDQAVREFVNANNLTVFIRGNVWGIVKP